MPLLESFDGVQVGDRLRVRDDLGDLSMISNLYVRDEMQELAGQVVTVRGFREINRVDIVEDTGHWAWSPSCFVTGIQESFEADFSARFDF